VGCKDIVTIAVILIAVIVVVVNTFVVCYEENLMYNISLNVRRV